MSAKLTEIQSADVFNAWKYFENTKKQLPGAYARWRNLERVITELTTDPPLPCGECGKCLDCIRKERSHER